MHSCLEFFFVIYIYYYAIFSYGREVVTLHKIILIIYCYFFKVIIVVIAYSKNQNVKCIIFVALNDFTLKLYLNISHNFPDQYIILKYVCDYA